MKTILRISCALLASLSILLAGSCVKVPAEAVVLSRTVGERLPDIQASHEAFVSAYFQVSRDRVEDFLNQRWIPTFLGKFVAGSNLMDKLQNVKPLTDEQNAALQAKLQNAGIPAAEQPKVIQAVNSALGDPDRGKLVLLFSEAALKQIAAERKSLLDPIDEQERISLDALRKVYAQVEQAQSTVTAHLSSVQKVTNEQDQVLERLNLLKSRDAVVDKALVVNQQIMGILDSGADPEDIARQLAGAVNKPAAPSQPHQ